MLLCSRRPLIHVVIGNDDFAAQDVDDIGVVPDGFGRERAAADLHAVERVVDHPVEADQRPVVVVELLEQRWIAPVVRP